MSVKIYDRVRAYLSENEGKNFTPTEIGVGIGFDKMDASSKVNASLKRLVAEGLISREDLTGTEAAGGRKGKYIVYRMF